MKSLFFSLVLAFSTAFTVNAQNEPEAMTKALKSTFAQFDTTMNLAVMVPLSTKFELIAGKYKDQWIAQYYAAYSKVLISYLEPDAATKDLYIDKAQEFMDVIIALKIENDERYIMEAYIANGRLAVDGEKRWMKYGNIFDNNMKKAKSLNENNVHYYYLKGTSLYYTPKMFGGGAENALPYFEKARELYAKMDKENILIPFWGSPATEYFIPLIQKEIEDAKKK